jgi:hypothetical protein
MSDPDLDLIQQTHDAHAALMARINGFLDQVDGDVAAAIALAQAELGVRQGAYDGLAANLKALIASELTVVCTWNPLAGADDPEKNIYTTFGALMDRIDESPEGASITVNVSQGETGIVDEQRTFEGKTLTINSQGGPGGSGLRFDQRGNNEFNGLVLRRSSVRLNGLTIEFGALAVPADPLGSGAAFEINGGDCSILTSCFYTCVNKGRIAYMNHGTGVFKMQFDGASLDGDIQGVSASNGPNVLLTARATTTANGAALYDAGVFTPGVNLLFQ